MTKERPAQDFFAQFASQMARNPHTLAQLRDAMDDAQRRAEISERIKTLREQRGLTQQQIATRLGAQLRTYQNWEAGGGTSGDNYEALAEILGVSYEFLVMGGDTAPPPQDILSRLDRLEGAVDEIREILVDMRANQTRLLAERAAAEVGRAAPRSKPKRATRPRAAKAS